jgi:hypothetical protein
MLISTKSFPNGKLILRQIALPKITNGPVEKNVFGENMWFGEENGKIVINIGSMSEQYFNSLSKIYLES